MDDLVGVAWFALEKVGARSGGARPSGDGAAGLTPRGSLSGLSSELREVRRVGLEVWRWGRAGEGEENTSSFWIKALAPGDDEVLFFRWLLPYGLSYFSGLGPEKVHDSSWPPMSGLSLSRKGLRDTKLFLARPLRPIEARGFLPVDLTSGDSFSEFDDLVNETLRSPEGKMTFFSAETLRVPAAALPLPDVERDRDDEVERVAEIPSPTTAGGAAETPFAGT